MSVKEKVVDIMRELKKKNDIEYILIRKEMKVVREMENEVMVMRNGKIVEYGKEKDIFENKKKEYKKDLMEEDLNMEKREGGIKK